MSQINFLYTQANLQSIADDIITKTLDAGATAAQVEVSESISTDIEILNQQTENFETSHENQLVLTVFKGTRKGHVGISNIQPHNLPEIIKNALDIATYTEEDPANGLLDKEYLLQELPPELGLYNLHSDSNHNLIDEAKELEQLARKYSPLITASDGSSLSLTRYNFVTANSNGFNRGYQTSRYSKYVSLIGENSGGMQTDYWYSSSRNFLQLDSNARVAELAGARVLRRLNKGTFSSSAPAVIFESSLAKSIIGSLIGALSGGSLYRRLSFLNDSLNTQILPQWFKVSENPFVFGGLSSCYFDNEGSQVYARDVIKSGVVNGYLLSSYTARKMNMTPTGNSGGSHNILVAHNVSGDLTTLAQQMVNGLIIIETIGHGLNMVTGDYSVGASALIVENGAIGYFVDNLTISGNMREIYKNILAVNANSDPGSIICGDMLIAPGVIQVNC